MGQKDVLWFTVHNREGQIGWLEITFHAAQGKKNNLLILQLHWEG